MIELRAVGAAQIDTGLTVLRPSQTVVFAVALYLILEGDSPVSRDRPAALVEPAAGPSLRGHRLRQTILQLKKLGLCVNASRHQLEVEASQIRCDVDLAIASDLELPRMSSLEFLPGYEPTISEPFREWIDTKRSQIHGKLTSRLVQEIESARHRGDWSRVEEAAERCLSLDSYNETAVLAQAEATAMRGAKRKAVSILDDFLTELGGSQSELRLPATLLRKRVMDRLPERTTFKPLDARFVGREPEMELLTHRFEAVRSGRGSAIQLLGQPGIGKTRLCQEFARFAELQGGYVEQARCRRTCVDRPISLFAELVPRLCELPGALGCDPNPLVTLRRLTEFDKSLNRISTSDQPQPLFENTTDAVFDLFDSVLDEKPLVIIVDDAQWLDATSQKLLVTIVEWAERKRLLVILNARDSTDLLTASFETVRLGPLSAPACKTLLESLPIAKDIAARDTFFGWCLNIAEGNPFFLQELLHHWLETGQTFEAPPSVTRILDERVARISADSRQVLQTASVLGHHASIERIQKVLDLPSHRILGAVEELSGAVMLKSGPEIPSDAHSAHLQPRHALLCSAALKTLAAPMLAFLHRRAADVIESELSIAGTPIALLWSCASHRDAAGDRNKALTVSLACAEHLLDVGLVADSVGAFKKSLEYCANDAQRLRVLPRLASAAQLSGAWDETKEALRTCIRIASKGDPGIAHNEFELTLFAVRMQSDLNFSPLLEDLMPCVTCGTASAEHRVRAAILALKIAADFGPPETLDTIFESVRPLLDDPQVHDAWRLELLTIYRTTRRHDAVPITELNTFAEAARLVGGELAYANALLTASSACRISGRYDEALQFLAKAYELAREKQRWSVIYRLHLQESRVHIAAERYDDAAKSLERAAACSVPPDHFTATDLQTYAVRLAIHRGDVSTAQRPLSELPPILMGFSTRRRAHT